ncbi:hypothetical protein JCM10207_006179 [Rhodosporidiobolus poonsookiae]
MSGPPLAICAKVDCVSIFLPILLGVLFSFLGLGLVFISSARFLALFPDPRFRRKRAMVLAVLVLQVVQTAMDGTRVLMIFALHFGDFLYFLHPRYADALAPLFGAILQIQTQVFLLARVHAYATVAQVGSKVKWAATVLLALVIAGSGAMGLATALEIKLLNSLIRLSPGHPQAPLLNIVAPTWLISSAFVDCTLCLVISHELLSARRAANGLSSISSQRTLDVLKRLVRVVLRSGIVLALAQTGTAIAWVVEARTAQGKISSSWVYLPIILLPKLYTLTYLAILIAPRRNWRQSVDTSSVFTAPLAAANNDPSPYLAPLTESRRRLFPQPPPEHHHPHNRDSPPFSNDIARHVTGSDHPYARTDNLTALPSTLSFSRNYPTRPGAPTPGSIIPAPYYDEEEKDDDPAMRDDSLVSRPHTPVSPSTPGVEAPTAGFRFRPQPLLLPLVATPVLNSGPPNRPAPAPTLPLSPPTSPPPNKPPSLPPAIAYNPSSPLSPTLSVTGSPTSPAAPPFSPPLPQTQTKSKGRMLLPHPPLSTVDEASTPRTLDFDSYTFPSPAQASARASWIQLSPVRATSGAGVGEEGSSGEEHLAVVQPVRYLPDEHAQPARARQERQPYVFPLSPPSSPDLAPSVLAASFAPDADCDPARPPLSPRLTERRGAVDLLPAEPGRPVRMEPSEEEGWVFPPPRSPARAGRQGAEERPRRRAMHEGRTSEAIGVALGGEEWEEDANATALPPPPPLVSRFSTPSPSSSFSTASTRSAIPAPSIHPPPRHRPKRHHRPKPSLSALSGSTAVTASPPNESDTTLDAVLRALRAPLHPPLPVFASSGSSASVSPDSALTHPRPAPLPPSPTSPNAHKPRFRPHLRRPPANVDAATDGHGHLRAASRSKWSLLSRSTTTATGSSSDSTFGCRDAPLVEAAAAAVARREALERRHDEVEADREEVLVEKGEGEGEAGDEADEGETSAAETTTTVERGISAF